MGWKEETREREREEGEKEEKKERDVEWSRLEAFRTTKGTTDDAARFRLRSK